MKNPIDGVSNDRSNNDCIGYILKYQVMLQITNIVKVEPVVHVRSIIGFFICENPDSNSPGVFWDLSEDLNQNMLTIIPTLSSVKDREFKCLLIFA